MVIFPFHDRERQSTTLVVVLQEANLERMKNADPITLHSTNAGGFLPAVLYPENLSLLIAYENDTVKILDMAGNGDVKGIISYLERGYMFVPGTDGVKYGVLPEQEGTGNEGNA